MMEFILVRHTTPDVERGTCYGQTDLPPASTFLQEADAVRSGLVGMEYDAVFSSPLQRCLDLARYCCGEKDIIIVPELMEMNFGEWEMRRFDDIDDPRLQEFYDDYLNYRCPGGESFRDLEARVGRFIDHLPQGCRPLIFTHGGVIAQFLLRSGKVPSDRPFANAPGYGSITRISL